MHNTAEFNVLVVGFHEDLQHVLDVGGIAPRSVYSIDSDTEPTEEEEEETTFTEHPMRKRYSKQHQQESFVVPAFDGNEGTNLHVHFLPEFGGVSKIKHVPKHKFDFGILCVNADQERLLITDDNGNHNNTIAAMKKLVREAERRLCILLVGEQTPLSKPKLVGLTNKQPSLRNFIFESITVDQPVGSVNQHQHQRRYSGGVGGAADRFAVMLENYRQALGGAPPSPLLDRSQNRPSKLPSYAARRTTSLYIIHYLLLALAAVSLLVGLVWVVNQKQALEAKERDMNEKRIALESELATLSAARAQLAEAMAQNQRDRREIEEWKIEREQQIRRIVRNAAELHANSKSLLDSTATTSSY